MGTHSGVAGRISKDEADAIAESEILYFATASGSPTAAQLERDDYTAAVLEKHFFSTFCSRALRRRVKDHGTESVQT
jgi:hypothetical protein